MVKQILLAVLIIFLFLQNSLSQKTTEGKPPILFRGVILDAKSQERLGSSQIVINKTRSAISAEDGTFSFYAFKNDTILFSMLGYKPASLIVNDTLTAQEFLTGVYLESDTLLLGEVIIVPKLPNLKAEMMNARIATDSKLENARSNITTASYVGRTTQNKLGDPASNYNYLRKQMSFDAFERGGIPSDRILGLSPFLLVPAAILLIKGLPELPPPPTAQISSKDLIDLQKRYIELNRNRK
jgi:hypothetical protein